MFRLSQIFQMWDREANCVHGPIFTEYNEKLAIRGFQHVLANPKHIVGQYPDQFDLKLLGHLNEETGEITPELPPKTIATGAQWLVDQERAAAIEVSRPKLES